MKIKIILISGCIWFVTLCVLFFSINYLLNATPSTFALFGLFFINFLLISACISTITIAILYMWRKLRSQKPPTNKQ